MPTGLDPTSPGDTAIDLPDMPQSDDPTTITSMPDIPSSTGGTVSVPPVPGGPASEIGGFPEAMTSRASDVSHAMTGPHQEGRVDAGTFPADMAPPPSEIPHHDPLQGPHPPITTAPGSFPNIGPLTPTGGGLIEGPARFGRDEPAHTPGGGAGFPGMGQESFKGDGGQFLPTGRDGMEASKGDSDMIAELRRIGSAVDRSADLLGQMLRRLQSGSGVTGPIHEESNPNLVWDINNFRAATSAASPSMPQSGAAKA